MRIIWRSFVRGLCKFIGLDSPYAAKSYGLNWTKQRQKCLERDEYRCRVCEKERPEMDRDPAVHHITPRSRFDESEWRTYNDLSNLVTLCHSCHGRLEGKYADCSPEEFAKKAKNNIISGRN